MSNEFDRDAIRQILIQPRTLVQAPITAVQADGVIRADNARFIANGVSQNHVIEVSSPTRNRGLYKVLSVRSETEIVLANPRAPDFPAPLAAEVPGAFTPINEFFSADPAIPDSHHGLRATGLAANNQGLLPFDMVEITGSASNNGIYQVQPVNDRAINLDFLAVYEPIALEAPGGSQIRGRPVIRVREEVFCDAADSGAVLVNHQQEVVGLLAGRVDGKVRAELKGYGFAAPIDAVTTSLGVNILTAANAGEELIVTADAGDPPPGGAVASGLDVGRTPLLHGDQRAALLRAQEELLETEAGRAYAELARRHQEEVRALINTNKRVAVVWHRNKGPLLAQVALQAVQHPDAAIPADVNGRPLTLCVSNILEILERYGSSPLKSDIAALGPSWTRFSGMTYNDVKNGIFPG